MQKKQHWIGIIFILINGLILISGWFYEAPIASRRTNLFVVSVIFFVSVICLVLLSYKKRIWRLAIIVFTILSIATLEYLSKYAVDYFYHSLFMLLILYILVYFPKKEGIIIAVVSTIVSFIKFVELLIIQPNIGNLSIVIFYGIIQILVLIIAIIARNYFEEGLRTKEIYHQLLETYKQLEASTKEIEQLSMEKERTKIARDLHDTLGHDMTGLIMQIEMGSRFIDQGETDQGRSLLEEAKQSARESLTKVRQIVKALKTGEAEKHSISSIESLCQAFSDKTGVHIDFSVQGNHSISPDIGIGLYRFVQESLTNSVRHGKATVIKVLVEFKEEELIATVEDNGKGCKTVIEGNGIKGMYERLAQLQGALTIDNKKGFKVTAKVPYY